MANQYVNKVELADGTSLIDISGDTVTAGSMLNGVTAHDKSGASVTGNIASKTSSDLTASTLTVTAPAGYYASNATKTLTDANLSAGNIKKDVTIFGVTGSYEGGGGGTTTIIVPEQTITASSSYTQLQFNEPLVAGEEYKYTINGNTATGTAVSQYGAVYLGVYSSGRLFDYSSPNMYFDVLDSSLYGTYTIKVWQESGGGGSTLIEKSITSNGVYNAADDDADGYSKVTVNVSGGGGGLVYESGTYTPASDTQNPSISFTNSHSTRPFYIVILDDSTSLPTSNSILLWQIVSYYDLYGSYMYNSSSTTTVYAELRYGNKTSSSGSYASGYVTSTSSLSTYMTSAGFTPAPTSTNRRFRSGRSYKWIAVWKP